MQYSLTTDAGLPTSENHTFNDDVEQGIAIFKLQCGRYYITHSNFMAKKVRSYALGLFENDTLREDKPIEFVEFYRLGTSKRKTYGATSDSRVVAEKNLAEFHNSIYFNAARKYGAENVISENFRKYGEEGFESKTSYVNEMMNHLVYGEMLTVLKEYPKGGKYE